MVLGSVNGAATFAFNGLICTAEVRVRRGLLAPNPTCFSRRCRRSQVDARQGGGWFMLSRPQGTNPQVPRFREPGWFLQLHAGHTATKQTMRLYARAAGATPV